MSDTNRAQNLEMLAELARDLVSIYPATGCAQWEPAWDRFVAVLDKLSRPGRREFSYEQREEIRAFFHEPKP